ncbi:MAG: tetratricopeptide repeat protein, partial [Verrucomicrobiota bacterium]
MLEKIPFFILSGIFCAVTFVVQRNSGAVLTLASIPMRMRIENAFVSYARYLGKLIWPVGLALPYPYPTEWPVALVIFSAALTVVLCAAAWLLGPRWPFVRTGWFWFFGTLIPVIGLVQVGAQSLADRYLYVPSIGIFIILAWGAGAGFERWNFPSWAAGAAAILVLGACAARTIDQLGYWRNSETLFRHAIASTRNNGLACDNLGLDLFGKGRLDEAAQAYATALKINPKDPIALDGLGCCWFNKGQMAEATKWFQRSLQVNTNQSNSLFNMGSVLAQQQQYPEAIKYFKDALQIDPENPDIYDSLGNVFLRQKRYADAIRCYEDASRVAPESPSPHNCLGAILYGLGKVDEAIHHYQESVWLAPGDPQTHIVLANILASQGRLQESASHYVKALQINPNSIEALNNLGWLLAGTGQYDKALECYTRAARLAPGQEVL